MKSSDASTQRKRGTIFSSLILRYVWYFTAGAVFVTLFWVLQSILTGQNLSEISALITPVLVGGTAGLVVGVLLKRSGDLARRLSVTNSNLRSDMERLKYVEAELLIKKQSLSSLINAFAIIDLDGTTSWVNPSFATMWRFSDYRHTVGRDFADFWKSPELLIEVFDKVREHGKWSRELIGLTKDGMEFHASAHFSYVRGESGEPVCFVASVLDISGRKRSEAQLRESEERFRGIFENATIGLYRTTPDGRILLANPALIRMLGYDSFDDLASRDLENYGYAPSNLREVYKSAMERDGMVRAFEISWQKKDGTTVHVRESAYAFRDQSGSILYYEGTVEDITEQKEIEKNLVEGAERFRNMVNTGDAGYFFIDNEGYYKDVNEAWLAMHGYQSKNEVLGKHYLSFIVEKEADISGETAEYLLSRDGINSREMVRKCKDGSIGYQLFSINPVQKGGRIIGAEGFLTDITDMKLAEQELERKLKREELLSRMSRSFAECDETDIDEIIEYGLMSLGEYEGADRATIFSIDPDKGMASITHEWCSEGVFSGREHLKQLPISMFKFFYGKLLKGEPVIVKSISALPPEAEMEREDLALGSIKSIAISPMLIRGKLVGMLSINGVRQEIQCREEDIKLLAVVCEMTTMTRQRIDATKSLIENERTLKAVLANIPAAATILFDHEMKILIAEGNSLAKAGYRSEYVIGRKLDQYDDLRILSMIKPHFEKALTGEISRGEFVFNDEYFLLQTSPVRDDNGEITAGVALFQNVNEQKKAEEALRASEERFRQLAESIDQVYWICDIDKNELSYVSPAFEVLFGVSNSNKYLNRNSWIEHIHEADRENVREFYSKQKQGYDGEMEYRVVRPDGSVRWVRDRAYPLFSSKGNLLRLTGVAEDITERKQVQIELRQSEATLRQVLDLVPHYIHAKDKSGKFILANRAVAESYGMTSIELIGRNQTEVAVSADEVEQMMNDDRRVIKSGEPLFRKGEEYTDVNSVTHWLETTRVPFSHFGVPSVLVVAIDITDRKRTEEALRESEERFRHMAELAPEGIFEMDEKGVIVFANHAALNIFGLTQEDIDVGITPLDVISPEDREIAGRRLREVLETSLAQSAGEYTGFRKDGSHIPFRANIRPMMKDGRVVGIRGVVSDLTDWRREEAERLKAQKLESIGVLAGGIAHDFNNILTGVMGNITLAQMIITDNEELQDVLHEAEIATERAAALTKQLLTFSKGGAPIREKTQLGEMITETARFATIGSNARCDFDIAEDLFMVEADVAQISQVVQNIVINADQSMPKGGIIEIAARNVTIEKDENESLKPGRYVCIEIRDSGVGIPEDNKPMIFDPFFTTKSTGEGLGLSTAYSIVKKHDGHIEVESQVGEGSMFAVYLPVSDETESQSPKDEQVSKVPRILVMDDDKLVSKFARTVIEREGYRVTCTLDGKEAALVYKEALDKGDPYNIVVLDLTVPGGVGGRDALELLKGIDPDVIAIASSGYSGEDTDVDTEEWGFAGFVAKPYKPAALISELQRFLPSAKPESKVKAK